MPFFVPGDLDLQTHPSEGPKTSSVWIWRKSVQGFPEIFHTQTKRTTDWWRLKQNLPQFIVCGNNNCYYDYFQLSFNWSSFLQYSGYGPGPPRENQWGQLQHVLYRTDALPIRELKALITTRIERVKVLSLTRHKTDVLPRQSLDLVLKKNKSNTTKANNRRTTTTPQPFYGPFSGTTRVSWCQKRTSGLYDATED